MNIAINGFGRIGRTFLRTVLQDAQAAQQLSVVAINIGPGNLDGLAHLFAYDSIMGKFPGSVTQEDGYLVVNNHRIALLAECDPTRINWATYKATWVVDASGHFTSREGAEKHLAAGAHKVLITAPATNEDVTIIPGVNEHAYQPDRHHIVSLGSCTTNCFTPLVKVIDEAFSIQQGSMTTVHSYTNDQVLLDVQHKDPRRARAAALSIIPTKTGAHALIGKLMPHLDGKMQALALRVPTPIVSLVDFSFATAQPITAERINAALQKAADGPLRGIIHMSNEPLVSCDFKGNPHSAIVDSALTHASGNLGTVYAWYDNEWGYSERLKDFLLHNCHNML